MNWVAKLALDVLHPHYIYNIILCGIFYFLKTVNPFCEHLFENCELEMREWELLTFLGCIVVVKNRKQNTYKQYISTLFMFAKLLSTFLFFRQNVYYGIIYVVFCLLQIAFLPEPTYSGPENIVYFRGLENIKNEIERDNRITWIIEFYVVWTPSCVNFAPIFSELSAKYTLTNLKFGKIDITRFPDVAKHYGIDASSWSKQLPTLIMFENGKETKRRPYVDEKGRVIKFVFAMDNICASLQLNELYLQCKKNLKDKTKVDSNDKQKKEM